jgi:flagellar biosynthesis/type III secretory pathway ATPase
MTKTEQIREQLWVEVLEDYVLLLQMTPYAKDKAKNMDECRKQLDKIVAWIEQKLAEQRGIQKAEMLSAIKGLGCEADIDSITIARVLNLLR